MSTTSESMEGLELYYDNNSSASFLVVKTKCDKQLYKYQLQMISSNRISHFIAFEMKQNDGSTYFYYNITSRLSLITFLKRRQLTRNEFIRILMDIAGTVVNSAGYLLSDTGFILDADYIYIDPVTLDIQLVYVPLKREGDVSAGFRDFISELILKYAEFEESDNGNFLQRVLNFSKNELFNVPDFYLFLNKLSTIKGKENYEQGVKAAIDRADSMVVNDFREEVNISNKSSIKGLSDSSNIKKPVKDNADEQQMTKKLSIPLLAAALVLQVVIAVAFILVVRYLKQEGNGGTTTFAALVLIAVAIDIFLFKKIISLGLISSTGTKKEKTEPKKANNSKTFKYDTYAVCSMEQADSIENYSESIAPVYMDTAVEDKSSCNTVMLSQGKREHPCLLGRYTTEMEEIIINKPEYLIGRLEGQVDYAISNSAVGKVHACIQTKENCCFLSDLNSVNGTFINNTRIDSNKEYELKDNDILAFANNQYVFLKP